MTAFGVFATLALLGAVHAAGVEGFDLSKVAYYDRVRNAFGLTPEQEAMLGTYGFVVVELPMGGTGLGRPDDFEIIDYDPKLRFEDFYYYKVYHNDLPVLITTDSMLHLFHVAFDCSLKMLERDCLYPRLLDITEHALASSTDDYARIPHDGSAEYWAVRNSTAYFAVALSLLQGREPSLPPEIEGDVSFFLDEILASETRFLPSGTWTIPEPPYSLGMQYDFTQFKVRGHYVGDETLERYFRGIMWYGRFPVFIPRADEEYAWSTRHFDYPSMIYMRDLLASSPASLDAWRTIYEVTSVMVGESDSINPLKLETALIHVFGQEDEYLDKIGSQASMASLRQELSRDEYQQRILSHALTKVEDSQFERRPVLFQFMGQRFVPDSYMFGLLCYDEVGRNSEGDRRILPKGLDVMAVLGSERAYQLLEPDFDYASYRDHLLSLKEAYQDLDEGDWLNSSYTAWLYALESLVDADYDERFPAFMRNLAWEDQKLNTALGSWAQLRHDTILYAKQPYIVNLVCSYPDAFVEPNPTFYARMLKLIRRTMDAASILEGEANRVASWLRRLEGIAEELRTISEKELAGQALSPGEVEFMKTLAWLCAGSGTFIGWYVDTIHEMASYSGSVTTLEAQVIADVATFPPGDIQYPPQILHVGTGYVNALITLYPKTDGNLVAAVGPVFSYYEFPLVGTVRLNDDEWKEMLVWSNRTAYLPGWVQDVYGRAQPIGTQANGPEPILPSVLGTIALPLLYRRPRRRVTARRCRIHREWTPTNSDKAPGSGLSMGESAVKARG